MTRSSNSSPQRNTTDCQFVNNFWGSGNFGYSSIQTRIKDSLKTLQELIDFYQEKIHIEKDYCKKLEKLTTKYTLGTHETGTLRKSLDKLNVENEQMISNNFKFIKSTDEINLGKLKTFQNMYVQKVNKLQHHMNKVFTKRQDAWKQLDQAKNNYRQDCIQIKQFKLLIQTSWGKELEKYERNYQKVNLGLNNSRKNYQIALGNYNEINDIYIKDWKISLNDFYKLELERIQTCKVNCFNYCNNIATLCVDNDQSVDLARTVFAQIQPAWDLQEFSNNYGTGDKIYQGCEFVEYMNGQEEKPIEYCLSNGSNPDHIPILSRTYSTYSSASNGVVHTKPTTTINNNKQLPPVAPITPAAPDISKPKTPSPTRKQPPEFADSESSLHHDVFSIKDKRHNSDEEVFTRSNGSSNYSNPTTYSNYSTNSSNSDQRHWASPRRKEKQLKQVQEQITRRATNDFSNIMKSPIPNLTKPNQQQVKVPVMKDFSIDFIAKALEDLNSGGNGDVNQFRRSVRSKTEASSKQSESRHQTEPTTPIKPQSDYVDDRHETATRYESINFNSPVKSLNFIQPTTPPSTTSKPRPKSLTLDTQKSDVFGQSTFSKKSTKSFLNLHSMINITPVNQKPYIGKARARYSFKPQAEGELLFKKGWYMYIIYKQEDNWYVCELGSNCEQYKGMIGLVPGNYLIEGDDLF
ncbi:Septation protein imp2 [Spathaspora sp. JA1]|nr:Septation protein imp2 [Spathaspora sp. JA1]